MASKLYRFSLLIFIFCLVIACSGSSGEDAVISISLGSSYAPDKAGVSIDEIRHVITLTGPTGKQTLSISGSGTARATVAAGIWRIEVEGFYGNDLYSVGSTTAEVRAGQNANVTIYMNVVWGASISGGGGGAALGGGGGGGGSSGISVTVSPSSALVTVGVTQQFTATVWGSTNLGVAWSVSGGNGLSSIDAAGLLSVDATETFGSILTIKAASVADPSASGSTTVTASDKFTAISPSLDETGMGTLLQTYTINMGPPNTLSVVVVNAASIAAQHSIIDTGAGSNALTYQWYSSVTSPINRLTDGTPISGQNGTSYTPPINAVGTVFYWIVVTNTIRNNGDSAIKVANEPSSVIEIEVQHKTATITGVTATARQYDATTAVSLSGGTLSGIEAGDTVNFTLGNGTIANANVGNGKAVTTNILLTGADAYKYTLTQPSGITVNITAKVITIAVSPPSTVQLTGMSASTTFSVTPSGILGTDTVTVNISSGYGLSLSSNTDIGNAARTITLTYDGITTVTTTSGISLSLSSGSTNYSFSGSFSTVSVRDGRDPSRVLSVSQGNIQAFNTYANGNGRGCYYQLTAAIDLFGITWTSIGDGYNPFSGQFDGGNYNISNLSSNKGLFGEVQGSSSTPAVVKNVRIVSGSISGAYSSAGAVVGMLYRYGTVENCFSSINVSGNSSVGGIVGSAYYDTTCIVRYCCSTGAVTGSSYSVGGVVGNSSGLIQNCYARGNVVGGDYNVGGVAGYNSGAVTNCYATGNIQNNGTSAQGTTGGVVGENMGTVQYCYATGTVACGGDYVGGVAGRNYGSGSSTQNCAALGTTITRNVSSGMTNFGRVVGMNDGGTLAANYGRPTFNNITVTVTSNAAGIHGATVTVGTPITTVFSGFGSAWTVPGGNLNAGGDLPSLNGMPQSHLPILPP